MKHSEVQHQLFRRFIVRELEESFLEAFLIHVNGTTLCFSLREFVVVIGLNFVGDVEDFKFNTKRPNRLVETYFGGAKTVKKTDLVKCFNDNNWGFDNDEDVVKIVVLYFMHTFILSSEKNCTIIPRKHFDLVEGGRYCDYPWGKEAFTALLKFISRKMDSQKKYYRITDMSLAMQMKYNNIQPIVTELAVIQNNHSMYSYIRF
ncbi:uncharacterized protein [Nicotiana sylvestris]|uniref:uncharacterized protein n=1 Tax=Nicotiana sylvestris TaxID=4096 RepID=UPI00388C6098